RVAAELRSADRPFMITVHEHPTLGLIELVKGAPEEVVKRCRFTAEERANVLAENQALASRGLRVLALGWRKSGPEGRSYGFAGLVGLMDPLRPGVRKARDTLCRAGVRTLMLTGDQSATARAIAKQLGMDAESVHSRVTPGDKLAIVQKLQAEGQIVAMTG